MLTPMLLTKAKAPFDHEDWCAEVKWDGYRAVAVVSRAGTQLWSRNRYLLNDRFPELTALYGHIKQSVIIDGEIVKLDRNGMAMFDRMRDKKIPATFIAFDVLKRGRHQLMNRELRERQEHLADLIADSDELMRSIPFGSGRWLYEQMLQREGEGIVLKRLTSWYTPGVRSTDWVKVHTPHGRAAIAKRTEWRGSIQRAIRI